MSRRKKTDSFWLSYSDLMTSLFFIMLVLFIVCIVVLKSESDVPTLRAKIYALQQENDKLKKELAKANKTIDGLKKTVGEYKVREEDYKKLLNLDNTFRSLNANGSLRYDDNHKTFIVKEFEGVEIFEPNRSVIKPQFLPTVDKVGKELQDLLKELNKNNTGSISYMLIIEGNAANTWDYKLDVNNPTLFNLSYQRAMALYKRWLEKGINLRKYNTEIQICGSGLNGINRDTKVEDNNKRFVIQIIPKISRSTD